METIEYNPLTGEVLASVTGVEASSSVLEEGRCRADVELPDGLELEDCYVEALGSSIIVKRKSKIDLVTECDGLAVSIFGSPPGSTIEVISDSLPTHAAECDGNDTIEFDMPGVYLIKITPPAMWYKEILEVTVG